MFAFLSKKINIPGGLKVNSVSWNKDDGFMAVGGEYCFIITQKRITQSS